MATTVHEPPRIDPERLPRNTGNGGSRNLVPADGDLRLTDAYSPPPSSTAIWVVMFAVMMMFAAFTSALFVRKGSSLDWQFTLPPLLYLNTVVLLASSITLEMARRRVARFMEGEKNEAAHPELWLYITLFLGLAFVAGQYMAWLQLRAQGVYLATNPSSSFFYLLTAVHAIHVLGGLGGLIYVIHKLNKSMLRRYQLTSAARYWHFMGILWVYLLIVLWLKL